MLTIRSRAELRDWLAVNHASALSVWLASFKRHHPDYLAYEPIVEELLCWGWIDSVTRALDADRSMILIAPHNPKSAWSAINKAHVARAREAWRMTAAGEAKVALAEANGMWAFLDDVERLEMPDDLARALADRAAGAVWEGFPRSIKRGTLEWIKTARTGVTRAARIGEVVEAASQGLRPRIFRR